MGNIVENIVFWIARIIIKLIQLFEPDGLVIFHKELDMCNYTKVALHAPKLYQENKSRDGLSEKKLFLGISLDTCVFYSKEDWFQSFSFKVMGFGFSFIKQTGY